MKSGDKIKFGKKYCEEMGRDDLLNKTIMLTPQYFEEDNGLYTFESECLGVFSEEDDEPDSIYHLFGNDLENLYDCELIPATEEDLQLIQEQKDKLEQEIDKEYELMGEYFEKLENGLI